MFQNMFIHKQFVCENNIIYYVTLISLQIFNITIIFMIINLLLLVSSLLYFSYY